MTWWQISIVCVSPSLIWAGLLCLLQRNRASRVRASAPPRPHENYGSPEPAGDGCSIEDYYFEAVLD